MQTSISSDSSTALLDESSFFQLQYLTILTIFCYQHFLWQMQFISELRNFNFAVLLLLRLIKMQDLELLQFWPPFDVKILWLSFWLIWQNNMFRVPSGMNLAKNVYVWRSNGICKLLSSFSSQPNAEFHLEQIYVLGFCWDYCWWNQTKPNRPQDSQFL